MGELCRLYSDIPNSKLEKPEKGTTHVEWFYDIAPWLYDILDREKTGLGFAFEYHDQERREELSKVVADTYDVPVLISEEIDSKNFFNKYAELAEQNFVPIIDEARSGTVEVVEAFSDDKRLLNNLQDEDLPPYRGAVK